MYHTYILLPEKRGDVGKDADSLIDGHTGRSWVPRTGLTTGWDESKLVDTGFQRHSL